MQITDSALASVSVRAMEDLLRVQATGARRPASNASSALSDALSLASGLSPAADTAPLMPTTEDELRVQMADLLLEQATGTRFGLDSLREFQARMSRVTQALEEGSGGGEAEEESSEFTAGGVIKTADGSELPFTALLSMSSSFVAAQRLNITLGQRTALANDLVFTYGGAASDLSTTAFAFRFARGANGLSLRA